MCRSPTTAISKISYLGREQPLLSLHTGLQMCWGKHGAPSELGSLSYRDGFILGALARRLQSCLLPTSSRDPIAQALEGPDWPCSAYPSPPIAPCPRHTALGSARGTLQTLNSRASLVWDMAIK